MRANVCVCVWLRVIQHCRHNMTWLLFIVISLHFVFEPDRFAWFFLSIIFTVYIRSVQILHLFSSLSFQQASIYCCWLVGRLVGSRSSLHVRVRLHKIRCTGCCAFVRMRLMFKFLVHIHAIQFSAQLVHPTWSVDSTATAVTRNATQSKFI